MTPFLKGGSFLHYELVRAVLSSASQPPGARLPGEARPHSQERPPYTLSSPCIT